MTAGARPLYEIATERLTVTPPGWYDAPNGEPERWFWDGKDWIDPADIIRPHYEKIFVEGLRMGYAMARAEHTETYRDRALFWLTERLPQFEKYWRLKSDEQLHEAVRAHLFQQAIEV